MGILRTVSILALVASLALGGAGIAFAQGQPDSQGGNPHSSGKPHGLFGEVSGLEDDVGETYTLTTRRGDVVSVNATSEAIYKVPGEPPSTEITEDFIDGVWVAMSGRWDGDIFQPKKVHLVPGKGLHFHFVGTVESYDVSDGVGTIVVECKKVGFVDFAVDGSTEYRPVVPESPLPQGTTVTVVASKWVTDNLLETHDTAMAKAIVVHDDEE